MNTFRVLFYVRNSKRNQVTKKVPIYCRITINGVRAYFSIKRSVDSHRWDSKRGSVKGTSEQAVSLNSYMSRVYNKLFRIYQAQLDSDYPPTSSLIKKLYFNSGRKRNSLMEVFTKHNEDMKNLVKIEYSLSTYKRYETTQMHLLNFLRMNYKADDIWLDELNYTFIQKLDNYFRIDRQCNNNTTVKYLKNFKKVIHYAALHGMIPDDPFKKYRMKLTEVKRDILTKNELKLIEYKELHSPRLDQVRDVFLFCCYSGLAFIDVKNLTQNSICVGSDGNPWIIIDRMKTKNRAEIPLLPKCEEILKKYNNHPKCVINDRLLPVCTNQRYNSYLKEIASICGINKNLTSHIARHTFATTVTLTNGVSIESISAMLGHKNIKTTQIYAKVVSEKISKDMDLVKNLLE